MPGPAPVTTATLPSRNISSPSGRASERRDRRCDASCDGRGLVRWELRAVVAVEAQFAAAQLPDREEVTLVALVVPRAELDVRGRTAVGGGHPPDALEAVAHLFGGGHRRVGDAMDAAAGRVV